jgi:hypothetical protein
MWTLADAWLNPRAQWFVSETARRSGRRLCPCQDFIEQREHSRMSPHVVDIDESSAAVKWAQSINRKVVRPTIVISYLKSGRY